MSELDGESRAALLRLARRAMEAELDGQEIARDPGWPAALDRAAGAFVTLRRREDGDLRGCVGYTEPLFPLWETVARAAVAAAFHDGRFAAVTAQELPELTIDVSVLSALFPLDARDVQVGRHGLVVRQGGRSGLLLPQVPGEFGWDREQFLSHTCRKAGLPQDAWRQPGCALLGFTAEYFGEEEQPPA